MQVYLDNLISNSTFPFLSHPTSSIQSSSSYLPSNRISFQTPPPFSSFKARATLNNGGITKPISEMTFYELLGIPETVDLSDIKHAYKQLARKYHPDVSPPDLVREYTDRFIRVQEAYETLSDARMRAIYDRDMARGLHLAFSARKKMNQFDDEVVFYAINFDLGFFYFLSLVFVFWYYLSWVSLFFNLDYSNFGGEFDAWFCQIYVLKLGFM